MNAHDPSVGASLAERFDRDVNLGIEAGKFNVPNVEIAIFRDPGGVGRLFSPSLACRSR